MNECIYCGHLGAVHNPGPEIDGDQYLRCGVYGCRSLCRFWNW